MAAKNLGRITAQTPLVPALQSWESYLTDQGRSPNTVKAFQSDVRLLTQFLPPDQAIGAITTRDLDRFFRWMEKERDVPCSPKTLARRITAIKAFFRWLHHNGAILVDPAEKVPQKSVLSPLPEVLNPDEVEAVLSAAEKTRRQAKADARPYTLVSLLLETGIKKGECITLGLNHVDLASPSGPLLFVRYTSPAQRYKERKIALPESWVSAFHEYRSQYNLGERLFPWSQRRLEYLLEDLGEEARLKKHLSFDMCRWTCALSDWDSGMERDKIRQKLGISKVQWREISMKLERLSG